MLDRNCLKRSGAKKVENGTEVPSRVVFVILQLRQEEDPEVGPFFGG